MCVNVTVYIKQCYAVCSFDCALLMFLNLYPQGAVEHSFGIATEMSLVHNRLQPIFTLHISEMVSRIKSFIDSLMFGCVTNIREIQYRNFHRQIIPKMEED
jgi:hypothetical protein